MANLLDTTEITAFESLYLDWIRNIGVFVVGAIALAHLGPTRDIAFWIFMLSIFLLIVIQVDYFIERENLVNQGIEIPVRLDWLWIGTTALLIIVLWLVWKFEWGM